MKNLSNTNKVLLGLGVLVVGYYAWKMWQSHEADEQSKKIVAPTESDTNTNPASVETNV